MKKTLLVATILLASMTTFAKNSKAIKNNYSKKLFKANMIENVDCTVTVTGTISIAGSGISIACAATASDCVKATDQALSCVSLAVNRAKKIFK